MRNADYWRQRARINSDAAHAEANEYIAHLEEIYREAVLSVQADLDRWFGRFADNNQITLAEAKKRLTEGELEEFHWSVDKYIKAAEEHGLDPAWQKKLENASARYHISRLEAIQTQIQQQAELVYGNQTDGLDELLRHVADNGYNHAAFDVMKGVGMGWDFTKLDQTRLDAMLKKPWTSDGKTFTDRCWEGKADLIDGIQRELVQSLMRGDSLAKTRDRIADRFQVSKYKAGRLAHTEATYFNAVSTQACYEDLGVEKIEILETLDKHTCEICAAMDGKVIDKKDYQPGVTVPPFHPNCRGTTCPWFDDMADVGQRIARDNEGEVYYVPPDMTYREWEKTFQEGGPKEGLAMSKRGVVTTFPDTEPVKHTEADLKEIKRYAAERGIQFRQLEMFDGDMAILRDQIDAIAEIRNEYQLKTPDPIKVTFADLKPGTLAMTNSRDKGANVITFDRSALRDRKKTIEYLNADEVLAAKDIKGIAYHEMGHVISHQYGEKGLEIARQAYYNVIGREPSRTELFSYLRKKVSIYSTDLPKELEDKPFKAGYYREVFPELLSMDKTGPSKYSAEFIRLIKEVYPL